MHFSALVWVILVGVYAAMVGGVVLLKPFMRSVADFLAAGRTAGRYLLSVSQGVAALGAITVVGYLEQNFVAGFSLTWWGFSQAIVILVLTVSGFVIYRFRQTRSLTLPEFFERIIPSNVTYAHDATWGDGNGFSHLRSALVGPSVTVPVSGGELVLGTWQQIVFLDFDNRPRSRRVHFSVVGE